jgi:hypothetical protein
MTQEGAWACREPVGSGLKDRHEIADLRERQFHPIREKVQRRAKRADD